MRFVLFGLVGCFNASLYDAKLADLQGCETGVFFLDGDGDGVGGPAFTACVDEVGVVTGGDCDDDDARVSPALEEVACNDLDDDCDATTPDAVDSDGDGFACSDCDDSDPTVSPGAVERCNGRDDDCDGTVDQGAVDPRVWYRDDDGDGFGNTVTLSCSEPPLHTHINGDCDDSDDTVHPTASEDCSAVDRDCDGDAWAGALHIPAWYVDHDGDGVGAGPPVERCEAPAAMVSTDGDCDDADPSVGLPVLWFVDLDADGHGVDGQLSCEPIEGRILAGDDCDDADPGVFSGAIETAADGVDADCDGFEACWVDLDGDGFGGILELGPLDCVGVGGDCNDADPDVNPTGVEVAGDGFDANCDGEDGCFADLDGDGWGSGDPVACGHQTGPLGDCDDQAATRHPFAAELPGDGVDQDCDGLDTCWRDGDGDGFGFGTPADAVADCRQDPAWAASPGDCALGDGDRFPGAAEIVGDGVDQDCDGVESCYPDADHDGVGAAPAAPMGGLACEAGYVTIAGDCADDDPMRRPGAPEIPGDGLDQDCDGLDLCFLDLDGDGFGSLGVPTVACGDELIAVDGDCDDMDPEVSPDAVELISDGKDGDCDSFELCHEDLDGDGFGTPNTVPSPNISCTDPGESESDRDCDDLDMDTFPGLGLVREVPGTYATVDDAVQASCDSDVVQVAAGTFASPVDLGDKEVQIVGAGMDVTFLTGRMQGAAVGLEGLTLTEGEGELGGCLNAGVGTLRNVALRGCTADVGGGAWLGPGSTWHGGEANGNSALAGGAVWAETSVLIQGVRFVGNTASFGAAIGGSGETALQGVVVYESLGDAVTLDRGTLEGVVVAGSSGAGLVVTVLDAVHVTTAGNAGFGVSAETLTRAEHVIAAHNGGLDLPGPLVHSLEFANGESHGVDPLFTLFPTSLPASDWDLHLRPLSPAVDRGPGLDLDGSPADCGGHGGILAADALYYQDLDMDGLYDGWELANGLSVGPNDRGGDLDLDGLDNQTELREGTRADRADTDGDGVDDADELLAGTDPRVH